MEGLERGARGAGGGGSVSGGGGGGGAASGSGGGGRSRAAVGVAAGAEAVAAAGMLGASSVGSGAATARSSGLTRRRPTFKKVGGEVAEDIYAELKDYLRFVKGIEGEEPDMGVVMENAFEALFRRAKGFKQWRKEEGADEEVEEALSGLGAGAPQSPPPGGGAQTPAAR